MKHRFDLAALGILLGPLLGLAGCSEPAPSGWAGYVEGEYVYVAAPIGGQLDQVRVKAGDRVIRGDALFALDAQVELAAQAEASARWVAAQAQAADAGKARRPDELAVTRAQLAQAKAAATLAQSAWVRQTELKTQGFVSAANVDAARAARDQAQARVVELAASVRVGLQPARSDLRDAAVAQAEAASQALKQAQWRLGQKQQHAPVKGQVAEVYFSEGEYAAPGQPVVSLLSPGAVKARFYVREDEVAALALGQSVSLSCDGCGPPVLATISRIATGPEFTPPVIYSNAQRAKLVFLIEAKPSAQDAARLHPGQPVEVVRAVEVKNP
ncbi:MAG: HlyD family efflux transporter periplasmic adaptor subunit [Burkholderiaceae bacterium]